MAKQDSKLEHRSFQENFHSQEKLSAQNSDLQHPVEVKNPCETAVNTTANSTHANRHRNPQIETDPAYLRALHWWRFRIALALYTGAFPNSMRLKPCSVTFVSYKQLLRLYKTRALYPRKK
ncbi:hypothetical protein [Reinekea sp. G2M2-21]|uniref:hypothetical protein n=1 Tax=Reinekea sp. G2M2-21 TaxID=2788942 RepID=UPI0018AC1001|nr:hypothetical protein [Reinekea sp. G2M2-21]